MFHKSQLKLLFEYIVYHTKDPTTFRTIAFVCKNFSKICSKYSPAKKNEFAVEKEFYFDFRLHKGKFLPNGLRHEIIFTIDVVNIEKSVIYNSGLCSVYPYCFCDNLEDCLCFNGLDVFSADRPKFKFMLLGGNYYRYQSYDDFLMIVFNNKKLKGNINFHKCEYCDKYHDLFLNFAEISFHFVVNCVLGKIYVTYSGNKSGDYMKAINKNNQTSRLISKFKKRNMIIKAVIAYASSLKIDFYFYMKKDIKIWRLCCICILLKYRTIMRGGVLIVNV